VGKKDGGFLDFASTISIGMSERAIRIATAVVLVGVYAGLLSYSVLWAGEPTTDTDQQQTARRTTVPPRVMHHDNDVDVYSRRSVRSSGQRGGGLRGGK
jgi:hypothetical protein